MVIKLLLAIGVMLVGLAFQCVGLITMFPTWINQIGLHAGTGPGDPIGILFCLFGAGWFWLAYHLITDR